MLDAFLRDGPTRHSELCDKAITERCQMFLPRRFVVRCRVPVPQLLASVDSRLCPLVPSRPLVLHLRGRAWLARKPGCSQS